MTNKLRENETSIMKFWFVDHRLSTLVQTRYSESSITTFDASFRTHMIIQRVKLAYVSIMYSIVVSSFSGVFSPQLFENEVNRLISPISLFWPSKASEMRLLVQGASLIQICINYLNPS